jgi:hypothetical protein
MKKIHYFLIVLVVMLIGIGFFSRDLLPNIAIADSRTKERSITVKPDEKRKLIRADRDLMPLVHNPPLNSVRAAHGNTDWHIDTANEFLYGTDMNGINTAANHCPNSWDREHIHVDQPHTENFYYDNDVTAAGNDCDADNGIDQSMLFFYAGHGEPTDFSSLGSAAYVENMRLGDYSSDDKGILRYYWQCSCEVFAHGPRLCTPDAEHEFTCPGEFDGSADSYNMRNVYERWGPVLDPCLRMACGVSTSAYCHEGNVNKIWDNYNNKGFDVADSFIDGLHAYEWVVPLCITTGCISPYQTTLMQDQYFTNDCNEYSGEYLHIQYLSNFDSNAPHLDIKDIPEFIPIWRWEPEPPPLKWEIDKFIEKDRILYSRDEIKGVGSKYRYNKLTGALYVRGERIPAEKAQVLDEKSYIEKAKSIVKELGWDEKSMMKPVGRRMLISSYPKAGIKDAKEVKTIQKNVILSAKRFIDVDGTQVKVLGEGGAIRIQMNNDGSLLNASKVWRRTTGEKKMVPVKKYEQAYDEAMKELGENSKMYRLSEWDWGYKEMSGNDEQREMTVVFQFNFVPVDTSRQMDFPPRIVEIAGTMK